MSFLLDALGKADDDRRRSEVPELRTRNQGRRSSLGRVVRGFVFLSLLLIFFALGYYLRPYLETTRLGQSLSNSDSQLPSTATGELEQSTAIQPEQAIMPENTPPEAVGRALALEVISYSDSPETRFVMINGAVIYEGEQLDTGQTLLLIEPDAVLLEQAGQQVRLGL